MNDLPPSARRALALTLLLLTLASGWLFGLRPLVLAARDAKEALADARFELHRTALLAADAAATTPEAVRAELDELRSLLFSLRATEDVAPRFVADIDQLLRASNLRLNHLRTGAPVRGATLIQLNADIQATGTEAAFIELLGSIERHHPILMVERLTLVSPIASPAVNDDEAPPELTVELRLAGFGAMLEPTAAEAPDAR